MYKRRGFTLVELLVVIAIIALLMSILMPALTKVKLQARSVVCMSNLSEWGKIFNMYTNENDGYFMHGWYGRPGCSDCQRESWPYSLRQYQDIRDKRGLQYCPMAAWKDLNKKNPTDMQGSTLYPWGGPDCFSFLGGERGDCSSYGTNSYIYNKWERDDDPTANDNHWKRSDVKGTGNIPVLTGATFITAAPWYQQGPPEYEGATHWSGALNAGGMGEVCIDRHYGGTNVLFMDWSVRRVRLKALWTLKWSRTFDISGPWTLAGDVINSDWGTVGTGWMEKLPY